MYYILNLLILSWMFTSQVYSYQYELSICTIFRDEAKYLKEWIEYHKLVGVQHFYLFDNLSQDDYQSLLLPYIQSGEVTLVTWPYESPNAHEWDRIQRQAYDKGIELSIGHTKWLAFIDTDEFIVPMGSNHLLDLLKNYENYGGVGINWLTFGTSGVEKIPKDKLLIETLLRRAKDDEANHTTIKSIVRPERVTLPIIAVHYVNYEPGFYCTDTDFGYISKEYSNTGKFDKIRCHHYRFRDRDFFFNVKIARQAKYWTAQQGIDLESLSNDVFDDTMLRFVPALRDILKETK